MHPLAILFGSLFLIALAAWLLIKYHVKPADGTTLSNLETPSLITWIISLLLAGGSIITPHKNAAFKDIPTK